MNLNRFRIMGSNVLGFDYFRQLAEKYLVISRDQRLQVEWVARGKYALVIASRPEIGRGATALKTRPCKASERNLRTSTK